nr:MAG: structural polyprotein [Sanxia picorna-like virus 9]
MPGKFSAGVGLNLVGNLWLLSNHVIKYDTGTVDIVLDPSDQNVSRNIAKITFCSKDITRIPNTDLAIMQIRAIAPGPNLVKYFPNKDIIRGCFSGKYHTISKNGERAIMDVVNIKGPGRCPVFGIAGYHGRVQFPTIVGDCGTVCVVDTGKGQVLLGTHTAGSLDGGVFLQHISQDMLRPYIAEFHAQVECGDIVPISAPGYERHITNIHVKSCLRFIENGTATVYGSFTGYRPKHKSKVTDTFIAEHVIEAGYAKENGAPDMTWKPWHLALKDMTAPQYSFNNDVLDKCEDAFFEDIISVIDGEDLKLEVYTQDVALNGVDGVTFVDMLNTSTSAGNPFKKSKKHFIEVTSEGKIASIDSVIQQRVDDIRTCYDKGKQYHPQFCGHLKDTPMPYSKIESGKTRVFTGGEFAWSIVVRMYLLSHIRLIQNNPFVFEAMPGIVAQSKEWGNLYAYLTKHGTHKIVAGDYGKFDKKMAAAFILSAFRILERLAARAGWPEEDIQYIRCIAYDTAFPVIDFNGDLIQIQGNPSGHPLTVIINCLVNSLYMRYAYYHISGCDIRTFRKHVNLATYGDDNIMSVSDDCPNFNHTRISVILKAIGVEYTMAEKEAESVPYIHIKDASFLKRKFVYDPDICAVVCPLDHSSIDKMLTSRLDEGLLDPRAHSICVIETALREYFFYGKEKYLDRLSFFKKLVTDLDLNDWVNQSTFPTYESLCEDFHNRLRNHPDHSIEMWGTRE